MLYRQSLLRPLHRNVVTLALAAAASTWLAPSTASAVTIAADLEADAPIDLEIDAAAAFALRLGWQLHIPALALTPEVGYHHAAFGDDVTLNRGFVGVRLGIGEIFRVGAYAHVGFGRATYHFARGDEDVTEATYDVGGFLDFTLLPLLNIGVHTGYGRLEAAEGEDPLQWVPLGAHAELVF